MRTYQYLQRSIILCLTLVGPMVVQAQTEDIKTIFDIHHLLGYLVAGFLITVFVMIFYNRLIFFRERDVTQQSKQLIDQDLRCEARPV